MEQIANQDARGNTATRQDKSGLGIILGPHRIRGTWADVCAMARNGYAVVRDGLDVRLVLSEAFETSEVLQ